MLRAGRYSGSLAVGCNCLPPVDREFVSPELTPASDRYPVTPFNLSAGDSPMLRFCFQRRRSPYPLPIPAKVCNSQFIGDCHAKPGQYHVCANSAPACVVNAASRFATASPTPASYTSRRG